MGGALCGAPLKACAEHSSHYCSTNSQTATLRHLANFVLPPRHLPQSCIPWPGGTFSSSKASVRREGLARRGLLGKSDGLFWQGQVRYKPGGLSERVNQRNVSVSAGFDGNSQTDADAEGYVKPKWEDGPSVPEAGLAATAVRESLETPNSSPNPNPNPDPNEPSFGRPESQESRLAKPAQSTSNARFGGAPAIGKQKWVRPGANPGLGSISPSERTSSFGKVTYTPSPSPAQVPTPTLSNVRSEGMWEGAPLRLLAFDNGARVPDYKGPSSSKPLNFDQTERRTLGDDSPALQAQTAASEIANQIPYPAPPPDLNQAQNPGSDPLNQVPNPAPNAARRKWEDDFSEPPEVLERSKSDDGLAGVAKALTTGARQKERASKWQNNRSLTQNKPAPTPPQEIPRSRLSAILSGDRSDGSDWESDGESSSRGGGGGWQNDPPRRQGLHFFKGPLEPAEADPEVNQRHIARWLSGAGVERRRRDEEDFEGEERRDLRGAVEDGSENGFGRQGQTSGNRVTSTAHSLGRQTAEDQEAENGPSSGLRSGFAPEVREEFSGQEFGSVRQNGGFGNQSRPRLRSGPASEAEGESGSQQTGARRHSEMKKAGLRRGFTRDLEGVSEGDGAVGVESRWRVSGSGQWESDSWRGLATEAEEEASASGQSGDRWTGRGRGSYLKRVPTVEVDRDSWLLGGPRPSSTRREDDFAHESLTGSGYSANPELEDRVVDEVSDLIGGREFVRVRLPRQDTNPVDVADLHQAIMQRDFSRVWWLVEQRGTDVNQLDDRILGYYTTALHVACEIGDPTMVSRLIANGAKADIPDEFGRFPIVSALIGKEGYLTKMAVIEALLQTGVGVQVRNPVNGKLPIHYSVIGPSELLVYLKDKGANIDGKDFEGRTALHDALDIQDTSDPAYRNVEYLLGLGARPNAADKQGRTPLHIAAERHEYVRCKELLRWKANVNARDRSGRTPMRYVRPQPYGEDSIISLFQRFRGHL